MKAVFVEQMLERGFLASTHFYSMVAHQREHVEQYLQAAGIRHALDSGTLENVLQGRPATLGFKRLT